MSARLKVSETTIHGVKLFEPEPRPDERGWFLRVFTADLYGEHGIDHTRLVQENQSRSRQRTIRGLHFRTELAEAKLVRVAHGAVFDVVVDLRPWSPSFLTWESFRLDDADHRQLYVPAGCAHGFQALTEPADVCYRVDAFYEPGLDGGLLYSDAELGIPWPLDDPIVSDRDRKQPSLSEVRPRLVEWFGTAPPTR